MTARHPMRVHLGILGALLALGILVTAVDTFGGRSGGLFSRLTVTRLYWLAFAVYGLVSTLDVLAVAAVQGIRGRRLTPFAVVMSHLLPIVLVWLLLSLGVHDWLQDAMRERPAATARQPADNSGSPTGAPDPARRVTPTKAAKVLEPEAQGADRD